MKNRMKAVLFDFGGVLADEGFQEGLKAIGRRNGLDPESFFATADALIYETGYLTGMVEEAEYWSALRKQTGISGSDQELRREILKRFLLRPKVIACADFLRSKGFIVAMLSDQTNWLEELDRETLLSRHFDRVFNSYRLRKSKRDASVFRDVCGDLGVKTGEALFIDDNINHIQRANDAGLQTIHFTTPDAFEEQIKNMLNEGWTHASSACTPERK